MSSELPLERLGLSNSFETRTSQAGDSPNEQRNEDVKSPDTSEKPQPSSAGVDPSSDEKEGKVETIGPEAEDDAGRVFAIELGSAQFSYRVPKGDESELTLVLYHENGTAQDLGNSGLVPNLDSKTDSTRDRYTAELPLQPIAQSYSDSRFFVVLDKSDAFGSFALGLFAVTDDTAKTGDIRKELLDEIDQNPDLEGGITDDDSPWAFEGISGVTGDDDNGGPDGSLSGDGNEDTETGGGGGGGLTTAAKAGIGAGVGVGSLILIGLAIFFFLRRRKRAATTNKSLTPATDYMRDKEVHSAQVAETPHSPASDDDNRPRDSTFAAAAPAADRSSAVATPSSEQRAVPHSVAHLVEEGMTEEQIRRLEEEERDLDQAIERAGRR